MKISFQRGQLFFEQAGVHTQIGLEIVQGQGSFVFQLILAFINLKIIGSSHQPIAPGFALLKSIPEATFPWKRLQDEQGSQHKKGNFQEVLGQFFVEVWRLHETRCFRRFDVDPNRAQPLAGLEIKSTKKTNTSIDKAYFHRKSVLLQRNF